MFLSKMFSGVAFFAIIHDAGWLIGGALGVTIVRGLEARRVIPRQSSTEKRAWEYRVTSPCVFLPMQFGSRYG